MDDDGKIVSTGFVHSWEFETVNAFQSEYRGSSDIVLLIVGDEIELLTLLGGYSVDHPFEQVLMDGKIFLVGGTGSSGFMVSENAYQSSLAGEVDGYLWVFDYDTYLTRGFTPDPPGPDYRPFTSLGLVVGSVVVWLIVMKRWFGGSNTLAEA